MALTIQVNSTNAPYLASSGANLTFSATGASITSYAWSVLYSPDGNNFGSPTSATPTMTVQKPGTTLVQLIINGDPTTTTTAIAWVPAAYLGYLPGGAWKSPDGFRTPAYGETTEANGYTIGSPPHTQTVSDGWQGTMDNLFWWIDLISGSGYSAMICQVENSYAGSGNEQVFSINAMNPSIGNGIPIVSVASADPTLTDGNNQIFVINMGIANIAAGAIGLFLVRGPVVLQQTPLIAAGTNLYIPGTGLGGQLTATQVNNAPMVGYAMWNDGGSNNLNAIWFDGTIGQFINQSAVTLAGAQTVAGVKTFSSSPVVPTPTGSTDAANKAYVDAIVVTPAIVAPTSTQFFDDFWGARIVGPWNTNNVAISNPGQPYYTGTLDMSTSGADWCGIDMSANTGNRVFTMAHNNGASNHTTGTFSWGVNVTNGGAISRMLIGLGSNAGDINSTGGQFIGFGCDSSSGLWYVAWNDGSHGSGGDVHIIPSINVGTGAYHTLTLDWTGANPAFLIDGVDCGISMTFDTMIGGPGSTLTSDVRFAPLAYLVTTGTTGPAAVLDLFSAVITNAQRG